MGIHCLEDDEAYSLQLELLGMSREAISRDLNQRRPVPIDISMEVAILVRYGATAIHDWPWNASGILEAARAIGLPVSMMIFHGGDGTDIVGWEFRPKDAIQ